MSLLERFGGGLSANLTAARQRLSGHLDDRAFARMWVDGTGDPHLSACAACRARFDTYDHWIQGLGDELRVEADRAFTTERLAAQQSQVARRLEALGRPPRVIPFPKAARAVISGHSHVRRWVTAAAAAGLIAGVGLGQMVGHSFDRHEPAAVGHFTAAEATHRATAIHSVMLAARIPATRC